MPTTVDLKQSCNQWQETLNFLAIEIGSIKIIKVRWRADRTESLSLSNWTAREIHPDVHVPCHKPSAKALMYWGHPSQNAGRTSGMYNAKKSSVGMLNSGSFVRNTPFTWYGGHAKSVARVWHRTALGHSYCMHMYFILLMLCMPMAYACHWLQRQPN